MKPQSGDVSARHSSLPPPPAAGSADAGEESGDDSGVLDADDDSPSTSCEARAHRINGSPSKAFDYLRGGITYHTIPY